MNSQLSVWCPPHKRWSLEVTIKHGSSSVSVEPYRRMLIWMLSDSSDAPDAYYTHCKNRPFSLLQRLRTHRMSKEALWTLSFYSSHNGHLSFYFYHSSRFWFAKKWKRQIKNFALLWSSAVMLRLPSFHGEFDWFRKRGALLPADWLSSLCVCGGRLDARCLAGGRLRDRNPVDFHPSVY